MPRPSPQTERVVAVIELLSERTDGGASMTEIADALRISQSSCVHVLAALASGGVVQRDADRRYFLGPALVRPGRLAAERYPVLAAARPEMAELSRRCAAPCMAFEPDGANARLVQHTGVGPPPIRLGDTIPLAPPLGMAFFAWAPVDDFDLWLDRSPELTDDDVEDYHRLREFVRDLGAVAEITSHPDPQGALVEMLDERASPYRDRQLHGALAPGGSFVLGELDDAHPVALADVSAPVFGGDGAACLSINLVTFGEPIGADRIRSLASDTRAAADRVTHAIGGRIPIDS